MMYIFKWYNIPENKKALLLQGFQILYKNIKYQLLHHKPWL